MNPWSYGMTIDDKEEDGVDPYARESLSTATHHANAVTLNAGLDLRRCDKTRSGARFNPERPLQSTMTGAELGLSTFDNVTSSKSIHNFISLFSADELVPGFRWSVAAQNIILSL
jgi:hypothetical protein